MALTNERLTPRLGDAPTITMLSLPVKAGAKIYAGALVVIENGYAAPARTAAALVAVGRAEETVDNTAGAAGAKLISVRQGVYKLKNSAGLDAIAQADVGQDCFIVDDEQVAKGNANGARSVAGKIIAVESDGVYVETRLFDTGYQGIDITLEAAADLTTHANKFVKVDANGKAALAAVGEFAVGVLQNAPGLGALARVRVLGVTKVLSGAAIARGAFIAADAASKAKAAAAATTNTADAGVAADPLIGSHACGIALETAAAADVAIAVLLVHAGAIPTTAA